MLKNPYRVTHVLIIRNAAGKHINGTVSRGDLDYAKRLAHSCLRVDQTGTRTFASIDIFQYDRNVSWRELQSLATVTLNDEEGVQ
jgi:hypothetical protein